MLRSFVTKSIAVDRTFISFSGIWSLQICGQVDLICWACVYHRNPSNS